MIFVLIFIFQDFLLDSIDLEAIAAKALQTKPTENKVTALSTPITNSLNRDPQPVNSTHLNKQFKPFSGGTGNNARNENRNNSTTPQNRSKKFVFKPKKSPEGTDTPRPTLSPVENSPNCSSGFNQSVSPVPGNPPSAVPTNNGDGLQTRIPGGATPQGLRTSNFHSNQVVQPPMAVTVKRDGSSVTKVGQPTFNPQVNQKPSTFTSELTPGEQNIQHVSSLRQLSNLNPTNLPSQQNKAVTTTKVFQKFVPLEKSSNVSTHSLRPTSTSQANSTTTQLRNPSMNSGAATNLSKTLIATTSHGGI